MEGPDHISARADTDAAARRGRALGLSAAVVLLAAGGYWLARGRRRPDISPVPSAAPVSGPADAARNLVEISPSKPLEGYVDPKEGESVTLRYNAAAGPLAGSTSVKMRWTANGSEAPPRETWPPGTVVEPSGSAATTLEPAGPGLFLARVPGAKSVWKLELAFFDGGAPDRSDLNGGGGWSLIYRSDLGGKAPDFAAYRAAYPVRTSAVRAAASSGESIGLSAPVFKTAVFDRRSESDDVVVFWRSQDATQSELERAIFTTQNLIACLREYFSVKALSQKVVIYYVNRPAGRGDSDAPVFHGTTPRGTIHLASAGFRPYPELVHELAHVMQNQAAAHVWHGETGDRDAVLVEGMAKFMEYCLGSNPKQGHAEALRLLRGPDRDKYLPIHAVTSAQYKRFFDVKGMYALDGSFVSYLVQTYDFPKVMQAFLKGSYADAFGKSSTELEDDWISWLNKNPS